MSPEEIAWGWVPGGDTAPTPVAHSKLSPLEALEQVIRPALEQTPCVVLFSGGCDSSLVLAVALRVARREGLPEPIALTRRYPGIEEATEDEWQELVARHVDLKEWERLEVTDDVDLLGPTATTSLRRHGVVWPPLVHTQGSFLTPAAGGSILTGEGGDEVLGPRRLAPVRVVLRGKATSVRRAAIYSTLALSPQVVRRAATRRLLRKRQHTDWLRPAARRAFEEAGARDVAAEPLNWRAAVQRHPRTRAIALARATLGAIAADAGVQRHDPLLHPDFLTAVTSAGGWLGPLDRPAALRQFFSAVLPKEVIERRTKSRFNRPVCGEHTRAFAESFTGGGADPELIDADALRDTWLSPEPNALSFALLQSCWLAAHQTEER
jgi:hypothetical protein